MAVLKDVRRLAERARPLGPPNYGVSAEKAALLRAETISIEDAMKLWPWHVRGFERGPASPEAVLGGVHRARVVWAGSTPAMVEASKLWLLQRGLKLP